MWPIAPGKDRCELDYNKYPKRTRFDDLGMFQFGFMWREAGNTIIATVKTMIFPAVLWTTLLQAVMGIFMGATGQILSFALLAAGSVIACPCLQHRCGT